MTEPRKPGKLYEDLLRAPPDKIAEILDGKLVLSPRQTVEQSTVAVCLMGDLVRPFQRAAGKPDGPGGWWFLAQPEIHLGEDIVVPDFAGWRRERMPSCPKGAYQELTPDWICEIVSPSSGALDRAIKMPIYGREQIAHVWLIEPAIRIIEVYRRQENQWLRAQAELGNVSLRLEPFDAIEVELGRWWGELP